MLFILWPFVNKMESSDFLLRLNSHALFLLLLFTQYGNSSNNVFSTNIAVGLCVCFFYCCRCCWFCFNVQAFRICSLNILIQSRIFSSWSIVFFLSLVFMHTTTVVMNVCTRPTRMLCTLRIDSSEKRNSNNLFL